MRTFHPDSQLPDCMMPDGGECCVAHAAVVEHWHEQRREIERLRSALSRIASEQKIYKGHGDYDIIPALDGDEAQLVARHALTDERN